MKTRLLIWVTSDCNLSCVNCSQSLTMQSFQGYQMSLQEVQKIIDKGLRYNIIEITGGEPTKWINIVEGVKLFKTIADEVTLTTNGNNPELVMSLGLNNYIVSSSQATKEQILKFAPDYHKIIFNSHKHKKLPTKPIADTLPADCCVRSTPYGEPQNNLMYIKGMVYYCCNAFNNNLIAPDSDLKCSFDADFLKYFRYKKYDKNICSVCVCNSKVWNKI